METVSGYEIFEEILRDYPDITEISVNSDDSIYIDNGSKILISKKINISTREALVRKTAGYLNKYANEANALLSETIPFFYNARFSAIVPPVSPYTISIRIPNNSDITLDDLILRDFFPRREYVEILRNAVKNKRNIIIAGSTGSGKTTFQKALLNEIKDERLIIIEDSQEIKTSNPNTVFFRSSHLYPTQFLVRESLRHSPDRIIVGELRDGDSTNELLKAWNTGHPGGITTLHADSARDAEKRVFDLLREKFPNPHESMLSPVHLIAYVNRSPLGRTLTELIFRDEKKKKNIRRF